MKKLKSIFGIFSFLLIIPSFCIGQNIYDTLRTVKMTATPNHQLSNLTIQWEDDLDINSYSLYKKLREDTTWGSPIFVAGDQDTSYIDSDIEEGKLYEYRMIKQTGDSLGYAYLFSGVNYLPPQKKGDILVLVDSAAVDLVEDNLNDYLNILISEGWKPWVEEVAKEASVQEVKGLILQYYGNVDSLTAVLLMGNIAVPHSGNITPDGHTDHKGAWPADLYYGDVDGIWTDVTVSNTSSAYPRLHNIPGDGNFDQDFIPSEIELGVGRMDFSELPVFENLDEYQLLDRYLQKNIEFRTGQYRVKRQAVFKNINPWKEGLGQNAIRNFVPLVSNDSLVYEDFFDAFYDSFLWSYGGSSGSMINSNGLGAITTYADNNFQAVFTAYFGSYYGDYDFENNYLRTILASGKVLSTAWVGAPNWYFHPMGLGFDLGFCTTLTQNNTTLYYGGVFPQSVTINLLGDPTLKAFIVFPPTNLSVTQNGNHINLSWSPSNDNILGYQVYKKIQGMDYFEPINTTLILDTNFIDSCIVGGATIEYLVKAVKQEITPSGSFINHSTGPIISLTTDPDILPEAAFDLSWEQGVLMGTNFSTNANQFQWILPNGTISLDDNFEIPYNEIGELSVILIVSNNCFTDTLEQFFLITDLSNQIDTEEIKIYPNPTNDFITLQTSMNIDKFQLFDILGTPIFTKINLVAGTSTIDIQNLNEGNYFIKIKIGDQMVSKMILLKK